MGERFRGFLRNHPKLVWLVGYGLVVLVVGALLILWDMGYECVRWSERIKLDGTTTRVCTERRPRWGPNVGE